ncbi:MAG: hypothetical protein CMF22_09420 [Idiomarinaceae bacterium]|nr:hypothetical protein [Idiomarinaceae bacterium]|tara:strand:+ start:53364 stop:54152 length:789 start_codon:yes stop_codon:yes gene_type:complete
MITGSVSRPAYSPLAKALNAVYHGGALYGELEPLIEALFGNGEAGAMYIPKPQVLGQQVLYQDAAGTVPVVADGDPAGLMLDVSGNDNHASQSTSAARPLYRTDGVRHWLEGDGVDDYMIAASLFLPQPYGLSIAFNEPSGTRFLLDGATGNNDGSIATVSGLRFYVGTGGIANSGYVLNTNAVATALANTGESYLRVDGVQSDGSVGSAALDGLVIGATGGTKSINFTNNIYGIAYREGGFGSSVLSDTEAYLAKLAGVTL